jgi:hypothetical protein
MGKKLYPGTCIRPGFTAMIRYQWKFSQMGKITISYKHN